MMQKLELMANLPSIARVTLSQVKSTPDAEQYDDVISVMMSDEY